MRSRPLSLSVAASQMAVAQAWARFCDSRLVRDATMLTAGGVIGHVVAFAVSPVLSRLYEPADFGVLSMFGAMLGLLATVACLRYELAIPAAEDERSAVGLLRLSLAATVLVGLLSVLALWAMSSTLEGRFGEIRARAFWLLPPAVVAAGSYMALSGYAVRRLWYRDLARTRIAQGFGYAASGVAFGVLGFGAFGLVIAQVLRHAAGSLRLAWLAFASTPAARAPDTAGLLRLARQWRHFPTRLVPAGLLNVASIQMPALAIPWLYGLETAGQFGLVQITLLVPVSFVAQSLGRVFVGHVAIRLRDAPSSAAPLALRMVLATALPAIGLAILFMVAAPSLYPMLFGARWQQAGAFAAILAPAVAAGLASGPVSQLLVLTGRTDWQLAWDVGRSGTVLASLAYAMAAELPAAQFLFLLSVVYSLFYLAHLMLVRRSLREKDGSCER